MTTTDDEKRERLQHLRDHTAYPGFRSAIAALHRLLHWVALLLFLVGLVTASQAGELWPGVMVFAGMFLYALLAVLAARWLTGLALVIADIGDGALEAPKRPSSDD